MKPVSRRREGSDTHRCAGRGLCAGRSRAPHLAAAEEAVVHDADALLGGRRDLELDRYDTLGVALEDGYLLHLADLLGLALDLLPQRLGRLTSRRLRSRSGRNTAARFAQRTARCARLLPQSFKVKDSRPNLRPFPRS
jgi:hypothetical protein